MDKVVWELPLQTQSKFLVGFVDLYVAVRQPRLALIGYTYADSRTRPGGLPPRARSEHAAGRRERPLASHAGVL